MQSCNVTAWLSKSLGFPSSREESLHTSTTCTTTYRTSPPVGSIYPTLCPWRAKRPELRVVCNWCLTSACMEPCKVAHPNTTTVVHVDKGRESVSYAHPMISLSACAFASFPLAIRPAQDQTKLRSTHAFSPSFCNSPQTETEETESAGAQQRHSTGGEN